MTVTEMKEQISRTEKVARRGLLTPREAELRITQLIDEGLVEDAFMGEKEHERLMAQRRLAERRKWRFLLDLTKDKERCV